MTLNTDTDDLTETMRRALRWLSRQGGSGVLDKQGRVLAGGEVGGTTKYRGYLPATWLRLFVRGYVEAADGRIVFTTKGELWIIENGDKE